MAQFRFSFTKRFLYHDLPKFMEKVVESGATMFLQYDPQEVATKVTVNVSNQEQFETLAEAANNYFFPEIDTFELLEFHKVQ